MCTAGFYIITFCPSRGKNVKRRKSTRAQHRRGREGYAKKNWVMAGKYAVYVIKNEKNKHRNKLKAAPDFKIYNIASFKLD